MNRARVMPNIQLPITSGCAHSIIICLIGKLSEYFRGGIWFAIRAQGFLWRGVFATHRRAGTKLPAEDSSESGNSPGAQEFQPLEQFLPQGTVVGFDYEESVRP